MSDLEMRLIFLQTLIEFLASLHDIIPGKKSAGDLLKYGVRYRGVRRTRAYCPALILMSYLTPNCSLHFDMDTFTYNEHNGFVQFSTNLTQKRLSYQNSSLISINRRPPVVHSPYSSSYDSSNIPIYWNLFLEDGH